MGTSRTERSKINIITGIIFQCSKIILPFLSRTAILVFLGSEYVGLSSLFTSILQVLSLAELGFSSAVVYNLYKPLSTNNTKLICGILNFYKRVYIIIGAVIFTTGCCLIPFLPQLISGTWPNDINIYVLYVLYLISTSCSYFLFAHKTALLNAVQRMDILNVVYLITHSVLEISKIVIIIATNNFYFTVVALILTNVIDNIIINIISNKLYPQYQSVGKIDSTLKLEIKDQIKALMVCRICDVARNSFDSIIISMLFGLVSVAIYSNYYYVFTAIYGMMQVISHSIQASVGNSMVEETVEKNYADLRKFHYLYNLINIFCTICLFCLYQPFMRIWTSEDLMLSNFNMALFCIYFYCINLNNIRNVYFNGGGYWKFAIKSYVLEAVGNLILNFTLGYLWGITGVLVATIITIIIYNFISRTNILFKHYFKLTPKNFYYENFAYFGVCMFLSAMISLMVNLITIESIAGFVLKSILTVSVSFIFLYIILRKGKYYREIKKLVFKTLKKDDKSTCHY